MLNADKASARAQKQVHNAQRQANKRKRKAEEMQLDDHSSGNAGEVQVRNQVICCSSVGSSRNRQDTAKPENATPVESVANDISTISKPSGPVYRFSAFEALAASGLRSIRYALEIPLLKFVRLSLPSFYTN